jgi:hypothetical protein
VSFVLLTARLWLSTIRHATGVVDGDCANLADSYVISWLLSPAPILCACVLQRTRGLQAAAESAAGVMGLLCP